MLDKVKENIVEITMVYCQLFRENAIQVTDSTDAKQTICELSEKFERIYKDKDWNANEDYLTVIEAFARDELIKQYSSQQKIG